MTKYDNIIIAGGGIAGVALALALHRQGHGVNVYEKASALREVGSGVVLACNGIKAADALGDDIGVKIREVGHNDSYLGLPYPFLSHRGKVKFEQPFDDMESKWGTPMINIHRADLLRTLVDAVPAEILHTDKAFTNVQQTLDGVHVSFADGTIVTGNLLIGADGLRSKVRETVFNDMTLNYTGVSSLRGVVTLKNSPYPAGFLTGGPGMQMFVTPLAENKFYYALTFKAPENTWRHKPEAQARTEIAQKVRGWHAPVQQMIEQTPLENFVIADIYDRDEMATWSQGRVVLIGDAAHPMTPYMGQGANMALEDAVALAHYLTHCSSHTEAFTQYEALRKSRTTKVTHQSRQFGTMGQIENPLAMFFMNRIMSLMMRFMDSDKQNEWLYNYTPVPSQN